MRTRPGNPPMFYLGLGLFVLGACTALSVETPEPEPPEMTVCGTLYASAYDLVRLEDRPEAYALGEIIFEYIEEWCDGGS